MPLTGRDGSTPFSRITKPLEISFRDAISGAVALPGASVGPFSDQLREPARFVMQRRPEIVARYRARPFTGYDRTPARCRLRRRALGRAEELVYRAARCGALLSVRCGRYRRFAERDIER